MTLNVTASAGTMGSMLNCQLKASEPLSCTERVTILNALNPAGALRGNWTELAVDIQFPNSWRSDALWLRVYADTASGSALLANVRLSALSAQQVGDATSSWVGRARVSGQFGTFRCEIFTTSPEAVPAGEAIVTMQAWGEEEGTPTVAAEDSSITAGPYPVGVSLLFARDSTRDATRSYPIDLPAGRFPVTVAPSSVTPWSRAISTALETNHLVKNSPGKMAAELFRIDATTPSGTYYVQLIDAVALPANGAVTMLRSPLKVVHTLGVDDNLSFDWPEGGIPGAAGLVLAVSTTEFTLTLAVAALASFNAWYA